MSLDGPKSISKIAPLDDELVALHMVSEPTLTIIGKFIEVVD